MQNFCSKWIKCMALGCIRPEVVSEVQDRVEPDKMPSVEVADRRTPRGSERANWKKQTL